MMRTPLTTIVAFHWAVIFGLVGLVATFGGGAGVAAVLSKMGAGYTEAAEHAPVLSILLAVGAATTAVLFAWAVFTCAFGAGAEAVEILRLGLAGAGLFLTGLALTGFVLDVSGLLPAVASCLAALLGSYLAVLAERLPGAHSMPHRGDGRATARLMALGAAHDTMLAKLSGRTAARIGGNG